LPKPHEPTLQPKHCQRACKANAPREIVLKNLPTLKKIKTATNLSCYPKPKPYRTTPPNLSTTPPKRNRGMFEIELGFIDVNKQSKALP